MDPRSRRPHMPGYEEMLNRGSGLLPWSWAEERLRHSRNYWISTVRADGRPHAMPVWGVWLDGALWFSTAVRSRKAKNLAANPACVVATESGAEAVIVEGRAECADGTTDLSGFRLAYEAKYDWDMEGFGEPVYRVVPRVVFGFIEMATDDTGSPTRWDFE